MIIELHDKTVTFFYKFPQIDGLSEIKVVTGPVPDT